MIRCALWWGYGMNNQTSKLIAFPIDRRVAMVRRAALELSELNGDDANTYWRKKAKALLQELAGQGRGIDDARQEVLRFFEAVQLEFREEMTGQRETISA
jgi:Family of unknown function (DUF6074)